MSTFTMSPLAASPALGRTTHALRRLDAFLDQVVAAARRDRAPRRARASTGVPDRRPAAARLALPTATAPGVEGLDRLLNPARPAPAGVVLESLPDEQLAMRAARDDERATRVLFDRASVYLFHYALSLGRDHDAAEDLVQETLTRAWENRTSYDPQYPYHVWVRTILCRLSASSARREKTFGTIASRHAEDGGVGYWHGAPADEEDALEQADVRERVAAVLAQLSEKDRALLTQFADGAKQSELARTAGVNAATLRGQVLRARQRFAAAYTARYGAPSGGL